LLSLKHRRTCCSILVRKMDRRNFIQQSGAAMFASMTASAAVSKVRTGMLGTGHSHFSGKLKAMMDSPDYEIAGIVENDLAAKARMQHDPRYSALKWMGEEELLKDPSIHLIVVECR